jgi:pimeloyl-ACP methyl ester carboxylesterase
MSIPVILLHGFGCDSRFWRPQTAALTAAGCAVFAPDLPYHGGPQEGVQRSLQGLAAYVAALPDEGPAVLIGHSLGGMIALQVAHDHPQRVAALALVDAFPSLELNCAYLPGMCVDGMEPELRGWIEKTRAEIIGRMTQAVYDEIWPSVVGFDARPWLSDLHRPVLGVYGGRGRYAVGDEDALRRDLRLTDVAGPVRVRIVPGAGHFVNLEQPQAVNEALVEWMGGR